MSRTTPSAEGMLSPLFTWRSALASEHGPVDHDLPVMREGVQTTTTVKGSTQRHVGLSLSLHMNERGGSCYPGVPLLAEETNLGQRSVQRALQALAAGGWIRVAIKKSPLETNLYTTTFPEGFPGGGVPGTPVYSGPIGGVPGTPKDDTEDVNVSPTEKLGSDLAEVIDAWRAKAPPLIKHRDAYLADAKTKAAIKRAMKVYPAEDIAKAISNYAIVLASSEYLWSHPWPLIQFLQRGLDRFVPEADPLSNKIRSNVQTGKPQLTADDFTQIPDL